MNRWNLFAAALVAAVWAGVWIGDVGVAGFGGGALVVEVGGCDVRSLKVLD